LRITSAHKEAVADVSTRRRLFYSARLMARTQKRLAEGNDDADLALHAIKLERRALEAIKLQMSELPEEHEWNMLRRSRNKVIQHPLTVVKAENMPGETARGSRRGWFGSIVSKSAVGVAGPKGF
jgi:hypothetical protein